MNKEPSNDKSVRGPKLSRDEIYRYSRHLIMPEVALAGQLRLKAARVLLVGAGGLGAPAGMYLAAAGIGKIGLADADVVDYTNLQRQVVFGTRDVGRPKLEAARDRLSDINPEIEIVAHETRIVSANARGIIKDYDVVLDCTDNFSARYLINDACVLARKPNVYGAVLRFKGQTTVFSGKDGPCYRCLYPEPPPPGSVPDCADAGVLGVLPGIIGSIQASETIKLMLGCGDSLSGRLLLLDAMTMKFQEIKLQKNPDCPVCGLEPTIKELHDYDEFCGAATPAITVPEIGPADLENKIASGSGILILDVREPHEFEISNLGGVLIPMGQLAARLKELDPGAETVVICRNGVRSAAVVEFLRRSGFENSWNLRGGINAWAKEVDPSLPKY